MQGLSERDYAVRVGLSRGAIQKAKAAGRLVERLENTEKANEIQRRMLEAAARRPRNRDELAQRLRDGEF